MDISAEQYEILLDEATRRWQAAGEPSNPGRFFVDTTADFIAAELNARIESSPYAESSLAAVQTYIESLQR